MYFEHNIVPVAIDQLKPALDKLAQQGWMLITAVPGQAQTQTVNKQGILVQGAAQPILLCILGRPVAPGQAQAEAPPEEPAEESGAILLKAA
jgi:hypothetical protein